MVQMQDVMSKPMPYFREGSIVKGRILEVRPREVLVDIGYKSEVVIPITEFDVVDSPEVGDEVDVLLERLENDEGMVVLSKEKAAYRQNWNKIVTVFQGDGLIKGKVKSVVKGGLMVNIGVEAFLPASQIDIVPPKDLQQFVGNSYDFKIGKITNLVPYGAFVELEEGVEGLIHVSELSWTKRIMRPSDILSVGQEVEAVVLGVNKEEQKISLGLRQLEPNPWDEIEKKFTI